LSAAASSSLYYQQYGSNATNDNMGESLGYDVGG